MGAGCYLEASPMEPMHAREYIKLLNEQCFEALFTFMAGVNLNTPILDHPQLILQLFSVGRVAVHELFEFTDLS